MNFIVVALAFFALASAEQSLSDFRQEALDTHNSLRAKHSAPDLSVDSDAQDFAQSWCEMIAGKDSLQHSSGSGYGENLYYSTGTPTGADAVNSWYSEKSDYDFSNPGYKSGVGHFTQVVWKSSTGLGCGRATSSSGKTFVCCNYTPAGNMLGDFEDNVLEN